MNIVVRYKKNIEDILYYIFRKSCSRLYYVVRQKYHRFLFPATWNDTWRD